MTSVFEVFKKTLSYSDHTICHGDHRWIKIGERLTAENECISVGMGAKKEPVRITCQEVHPDAAFFEIAYEGYEAPFAVADEPVEVPICHVQESPFQSEFNQEGEIVLVIDSVLVVVKEL